MSTLTSVAVPARDTVVANSSSAETSAFCSATPLVVPNAPPDGPFSSSVQREVNVDLVDEELSALNVKTRDVGHLDYILACEKLLVKCVKEHDAHKAGHGMEKEAFETLRFSILKRMPSRILCNHETHTTKSIRERYKRLEEHHRDDVQDNKSFWVTLKW